MDRATIDACRRALMNIQAGPDAEETVDTLAKGLGDLTNVVLALLDDVDAVESKAERRAAIEGTVDVRLRPLIITGLPTDVALHGPGPREWDDLSQKFSRARVVFGVTIIGEVLVLKNNLGPHDQAATIVKWSAP